MNKQEVERFRHGIVAINEEVEGCLRAGLIYVFGGNKYDEDVIVAPDVVREEVKGLFKELGLVLVEESDKWFGSNPEGTEYHVELRLKKNMVRLCKQTGEKGFKDRGTQEIIAGLIVEDTLDVRKVNEEEIIEDAEELKRAGIGKKEFDKVLKSNARYGIPGGMSDLKKAGITTNMIVKVKEVKRKWKEVDLDKVRQYL